jgi:D-glucosaminate-6-phosphate ammonia-lyase
MPPAVVEAMAQAAQAFVRMDELQAKAGEIIAQATGAESGYVVSGAAAGLLLAAAACMAGEDPVKIALLPETSGMRNEIVVQKGHRTDYDHAVRTAGARFVEIGYPGETMEWELEARITERTAAVLYVANRPAGPLALPVVTAVAHRRGVPVIVDAAAALPPRDNLRRFTGEGADLVVFSGGKALRGPQASGIIAGKAALIRSIALQHLDMDVRAVNWRGPFTSDLGRPYHGIGRPLKVGKEEVVGCLVALQVFLEQDPAENELGARRCTDYLAASIAALGGLRATVVTTFGGRPQPVVRVDVEPPLSVLDVVRRLEDGEPRICVNDSLLDEGAFIVHPFNLAEGEAEQVVSRLREIVADLK